MSLGAALQIAQNSLLNVSKRTNVVSRNITDASNENYTRRSGVMESTDRGSRVVVVRSSANAQLSQAHLQALADSQAQSLLSSRLDQLHVSINGADGSRSPSALLTKLHGSLQTFSADPSNSLLASSALQDARDLVNGLNNASSSVQSFRVQMDMDIERETAKLNNLLSQFHQANADVVDATRGNRDANDALDRRDALLKDITKIVPVNVLKREGNDAVLVTKGGATLYEAMPRTVTFEAMTNYTPGSQGNAIRIDGVPVMGGQGANTNSGGTLSAMIQLRDDSTAKMQGQLDEVARGLITAFAEKDPSGGALPSLTGLFSYSGGPGLPPAGTAIDGLASDIRLNAAYDPAQGGSANLLRDGGANGPGYLANSSGGASFADNLISLVQSLDVSTDFDEQTGVGGTMGLMSYAAQSVGWLDGQRSDATQATTSKEALFTRLSEKLSNETGVNIDEEMAMLLQLEQSYEASARLISAVDEMMNALLAAVR